MEAEEKEEEDEDEDVRWILRIVSKTCRNPRWTEGEDMVSWNSARGRMRASMLIICNALHAKQMTPWLWDDVALPTSNASLRSRR